MAADGWRLTRRPWADLSGEGARLHGGRWNSPGHAVVYLSEEAKNLLYGQTREQLLERRKARRAAKG